MIHDFETLVSRENTGSGKWDEMTKEHPNLPENVAPLSVADMELKNPPEIVEGLKKYIDTHILGYTGPTEAYFDAVRGWMKRRNNWDVAKEEIVVTHGVVTALFVAVLAYTEPGDGVITMPPVYYPFKMSIEHNGRENVECPLINTNEVYTIDFDLFEKQCAEEKNKLFIFCNPHNPVGRVWTEEEITKIGAICAKHNVIVISDEIHSDLIMPGHKHVAFANACKDALPKYLVCTAPSKSFNLATLQTSNIMIPDKELREKFETVLKKVFTPSAGALGLEACRLGYTECEGWLSEVIDLIYKNYKNFCTFIDANCPGVTYSDLQGTYLMWIDCTTFGLDDEALDKLLRKHDLYCDAGSLFSTGGTMHTRINLAGPEKMLNAAMQRFKDAYDEAKNA